MTYTGSCHCGKVAIEVEGEIDSGLACNCSMCGRRGSLLWFVSRAQLKLTTRDEDAATYEFNKHKIHHRFCPECGSPVITDAEAYPGIHIVKAGTLDDPSSVKPRRQIFCDSKHAWMPILDGIPAYQKAVPPST